MRAALLASAVLLAAGCGGSSPLLIDDDRTADREEKKAQESIMEIERKVRRGELPKINFEFDKDEITPESYPTLDLIADILLANPRLKVIALAHTDSVGTEEYNQDLSERRAKSVKEYLVKRGVPPPSVRFKGFGFSRPVADNGTAEGQAQNRRVEFRVTTRDWKTVY
jgi:outer membrane protein OmpA-like peptidoglycan-associated protein